MFIFSTSKAHAACRACSDFGEEFSFATRLYCFLQKERHLKKCSRNPPVSIAFQYLRCLVQRNPWLHIIQLGKTLVLEALQMLESRVDWTEQLMTPYLKAQHQQWSRRRCMVKELGKDKDAVMTCNLVNTIINHPQNWHKCYKHSQMVGLCWSSNRPSIPFAMSGCHFRMRRLPCRRLKIGNVMPWTTPWAVRVPWAATIAGHDGTRMGVYGNRKYGWLGISIETISNNI